MVSSEKGEMTDNLEFLRMDDLHCSNARQTPNESVDSVHSRQQIETPDAYKASPFRLTSFYRDSGTLCL